MVLIHWPFGIAQHFNHIRIAVIFHDSSKVKKGKSQNSYQGKRSTIVSTPLQQPASEDALCHCMLMMKSALQLLECQHMHMQNQICSRLSSTRSHHGATRYNKGVKAKAACGFIHLGGTICGCQASHSDEASSFHTTGSCVQLSWLCSIWEEQQVGSSSILQSIGISISRFSKCLWWLLW